MLGESQANVLNANEDTYRLRTMSKDSVTSLESSTSNAKSGASQSTRTGLLNIKIPSFSFGNKAEAPTVAMEYAMATVATSSNTPTSPRPLPVSPKTASRLYRALSVSSTVGEARFYSPSQKMFNQEDRQFDSSKQLAVRPRRSVSGDFTNTHDSPAAADISRTFNSDAISVAINNHRRSKTTPDSLVDATARGSSTRSSGSSLVDTGT
jgi:hypothetical protein